MPAKARRGQAAGTESSTPATPLAKGLWTLKGFGKGGTVSVPSDYLISICVGKREVGRLGGHPSLEQIHRRAVFCSLKIDLQPKPIFEFPLSELGNPETRSIPLKIHQAQAPI